MGALWTGIKASIGDGIAGAIISILAILLSMVVGDLTLSLDSPEWIAFLLVGAIIALTVKGIVLGFLWGWD